jgi:23S rRNA (uracil1939-C5)-methyltransferase
VSEPIRIRAIAAGGDGVGTLPDGRTVFVPRTAPGDLVDLGELRLARRFARGRVARLLESAPGRVLPRCPHYDGDSCGSCQLQHLSATAQRVARRQLVGDALRRIGHLATEDPPLEPSDTEWEYRTKITLAARSGRIGYHRLGQPGNVFDLLQCPIARPELNALWTALRAQRRMLPRQLEQLVLRVDRGGGCHAIVRTREGDAWTGGPELGKVLSKAGVDAVLWWEPAGGAPRTVYGAPEAYPVMVFEQIHPTMGDRVRAYAIQELGEIRGRHLWDLYAGIGETARALAERGATVESVEVDPRAVRVAEAQGPAGVTRIAARVEDALARLRQPEAVIVNPPRTGLAAELTSRLTARPPARVVYLSCDPATLARDLARLDGAYRLAALKAFDLFPQTAHVETVARLEAR